MNYAVSVFLLLCVLILGLLGLFRTEPALKKQDQCCEELQARMAVKDAELLLYEEQVKRLLAGNEVLTREIADLKSRMPIKWRAK
jgi:hypothetical protein